MHKRKRELITLIKELARAVDDEVIDALLQNVKIFRRTIERERPE